MSEVAIPNKASTVIVVRPEARGGFEVLMTRRAQDMQFLAGFLVFPGGGVENADWSDRMLALCRGLTPDAARQILGAEFGPEMSMGHWVAAIRELFEETGIHLFVNEDGKTPDAARADIAERLQLKRGALSTGVIDLAGLLESEGLFCDLGRVIYFFHRITPEKYPVRFDTRFYLTALPENQSPLASSEEVAESLWITPDEALEQAESGRFSMMPPTIIALRTLSEQKTSQDLWRKFRLR
jgi:8-oxo-dGTP pyrophosphatase MutT (NUDIX family)